MWRVHEKQEAAGTVRVEHDEDLVQVSVRGLAQRRRLLVGDGAAELADVVLRIADLLRHCAHLIPHSLDFLDLPLAFALAPLHSRLDISESAHLCAGVNDVGGRSGELVAGIW